MLHHLYRPRTGEKFITHIRSTANEAFNNKVTKRATKRLDHWATYRMRVEISIHETNEGEIATINMLRTAFDLEKLSSGDKVLLEHKIAQDKRHALRNRDDLEKKNAERR